HATFLELWRSTEKRERSGLAVLVGGLGSGKALALDTELPTPDGWTMMERIQVGDRLLGSNGLPVPVVAATDVMIDRPCYRVQFSDGTSVVADAEHQWLTWTHRERVSDLRASKRDAIRGFDWRDQRDKRVLPCVR